MTEITSGKIAAVRDKIKAELDASRYEHTLGVAYTAACLGMLYGEAPLKCELAGLLHDCAKNMSSAVLISKCAEAGIELSKEEIRSPQVIHAKYGAYLAKSKYGITDEDIINAVRYHTTGRASMSMLEKIIYTADFIEPMRSKARCLKKVRSLAFKDIDRAVCTILEETLFYLRSKGMPVESDTLDAYRYFKTMI